MTATLLDHLSLLKRAAAGDGRDVRQPSALHGARQPVSPACPSDGTSQVPASSSAPRPLDPNRSGAPSFAAAMVDIAPILPTVAAFATVYAYLGGPTVVDGLLHQAPLLAGAGIALLVGFVAMLLYRPCFTAAEHAHRESFAEIRQRVDGLAAQLGVLQATRTAEATVSERLTIDEAAAHLRALEHELMQGGPQWSLGTGYVSALTRLHRAEEALIAVQPADHVLAGALFDELRLTGSTIVGRDRLVGRLRSAVHALQPSAAVYLQEPCVPLPADRPATSTPPRQAGVEGPAGNVMALTLATTAGEHRPEPDADGADGTPGVCSARAASSAAEARVALREVRRALNDFRDESRARLIRSRGRLLGTMTVTGAITYVLLAFAVTMSSGQSAGLDDSIAAAAAIYLVGAVVGLFNRLYVESGDDAAGEDYGLARTRLLLTPMLSGLAAVGGVLITGMVSGIVDVNAITPTPLVDAALASPGALVTRVPLSLNDIFNLRAYPFALALAAMFGLMPKTFLERLHRVGEQSRLDLKSTTANPPAAAPDR